MKKVKLIIGGLFIVGVMMFNISIFFNKTDALTNNNLSMLKSSALASEGEGGGKYAIDYSLETNYCPNGIDEYKRCEPETGSKCDIHAQVSC